MQTTSFNQLVVIFDKLLHGSLVLDHSKRVADLAYKIGDKLRLKQVDKTALYQAAYLHDIGWIYNLKNENQLLTNFTHPDDGYFLFLRFIGDHKVAELIRHHHCYPKEYTPAFNEFERGYPIEVCQQLDKLDPLLQILQICNEYDYLNNYTDKDPITEIVYAATIGRWDLGLARDLVSFL